MVRISLSKSFLQATAKKKEHFLVANNQYLVHNY